MKIISYFQNRATQWWSQDLISGEKFISNTHIHTRACKYLRVILLLYTNFLEEEQIIIL